MRWSRVNLVMALLPSSWEDWPWISFTVLQCIPGLLSAFLQRLVQYSCYRDTEQRYNSVLSILQYPISLKFTNWFAGFVVVPLHWQSCRFLFLFYLFFLAPGTISNSNFSGSTYIYMHWVRHDNLGLNHTIRDTLCYTFSVAKTSSHSKEFCLIV